MRKEHLAMGLELPSSSVGKALTTQARRPELKFPETLKSQAHSMKHPQSQQTSPGSSCASQPGLTGNSKQQRWQVWDGWLRVLFLQRTRV